MVTGSTAELPRPQPVFSLICGGFAGCIGKTVTAPLSRLTVLSQTSSLLAGSSTSAASSCGSAAKGGAFADGAIFQGLGRIVRSEGYRGLWKGNVCTLVHRFPFTGVNFAVHEMLKQQMPLSWQRSVLGKFFPGAMAGCVAVIICYPLEVARTRLMTESRLNGRYKTPWACISKLISEGSLYRGMGVSLLVTAPCVSASFGAYDLIKEQMRLLGFEPGSAFVTTVSGGLSGLVGSSLTFPLDTVRRRMQVGGMADVNRTMLQEARSLWQMEGARGFYRGISPEMMKVFPCVALTFWVFEVLRSRGTKVF